MWRCAKTLLQTQFRAICVHAYYAEDDFIVTTQNNCHQLRVEEFKHSKNRIFMSYIYRNAYRQFTIDSCIQLNTPFRGLPPSQLKCLSSYHRKDSISIANGLIFQQPPPPTQCCPIIEFLAKRLEFYVLILEFLSYILNFLRIIFSKVSSPLHVFATDLLSIKIEDLLYLLNSGAALAFQVDLFARIDSRSKASKYVILRYHQITNKSSMQ